MKPIKVTDIKQVDPSKYIEGDLFTTDKQLAILHNGKVEPLVKQSDLKGYMKKADVQKLIDESLKKGEK